MVWKGILKVCEILKPVTQLAILYVDRGHTWRKSPGVSLPSAYQIADIWHVGYRRLNPPALPSLPVPAIFSSFHSESPVKLINQGGDIITWLFKTAEDIENCFWTEEKEVNLITLWSERPCFFDVTSSDCGNRLKNEIQVFDHIFLLSHFSERFLERFSCKIMAAANNFFCFAVAILFVYIGSRNF